MGLNSVFMILNDQYYEIEKNPKHFWRQCWDSLCNVTKHPIHFGLGTAITQHHADLTSVIAVGGNYATVLGMIDQSSHHTEEAQIKILKQLAKDRGYRLVRIAYRTCENCGRRTNKFKLLPPEGTLVCPECYENYKS